MNKKYWITFILALSINFIQSSYAAKSDKTDHPLLTSYAGSKLYSKNIKQFDEYKVFKGWDKETKKYQTQMLEGKVTKILYQNPAERSVLELHRNYQNALNDDGVTVLYECNQANKECVDGYVGSHIRREFGITAINNKAGRYTFAKLDQKDQIAYLILAVNENYTDIHVIEMKKMETDQVALNIMALTQDLDKKGFVVIEGIYFDTDKTALKAESQPAINEVAKLLKERPALKLYVVGHTDIQGGLSHNMTLSTDRARAVVKVLIDKHNISADRLKAHGVGPLAPVASNAQNKGRAENRRVVLVQR